VKEMGAVGIAVILAALAGCTPPSPSFRGRLIQYVEAPGKADAFRKADNRCNAYGRAAEVVSFDASASRMVFRCIEP
jgi:hypothetical protein